MTLGAVFGISTPTIFEYRSAGETRSGWTRGQGRPPSVKRALFFHFLGEVQAGALREAIEENEPEDHMPVPDETRNGAEYCLRVRGDSMDEVFPEGTVLFCRPFDEENEELPLGKYVIAVVSSKDTEQIKATVKKLVHDKDVNLVLRPESTNKGLHG